MKNYFHSITCLEIYSHIIILIHPRTISLSTNPHFYSSDFKTFL